MAQAEVYRTKLLRYWLKVYQKLCTELEIMPKKRYIDENYFGVENAKALNLGEVDLSNYCTKNRNLEGCQSTINKLTERIELTLDFTCIPPNKTNELRDKIEYDVMEMLKSVSSNEIRFYPHVYGSFACGLASHDSNINVHVECHHVNPKLLWRIMHDRISLHGSTKFTEIKFHPADPQPLLKAVHISTGIETVISFTNQLRLKNLELMRTYLHLNLYLKPLTLYLRHILIVYQLHGSDKITTNHLFWLVIYYFQRKKLLPAVKDLRAIVDGSKYYIDEKWNCTVPMPESISLTKNNLSEQSIASLFLGFLGFYKNFDFLRYVISPYVGYAVSIHDFDSWNIPMDTMDAQKFIISYERVGKPSFIKNLINYQDPTMLHSNLFEGVPMYAINSFKKVCKFLYQYYWAEIFSKNNSSLPETFPLDSPIALMQSTSIILNTRGVFPPNSMEECVIFAIRFIMEVSLKFDLLKIIPRVENKINTSVTAIYFDYCIESKKCNTITSLIMSRNIYSNIPECIDDFEPESFRNTLLRFYIVCEIYNNDKIILHVEGTARLVEFFSRYGQSLLQRILLRTEVKSRTK